MADVVTSQVIEEGPRWLVMQFTNFSDGTGETAVVKVNAASSHGIVVAGQTFYPGLNLKIRGVSYAVTGMTLGLLWAATTPANIMLLSGTDHQMFDRFGGISNPGVAALPGATGNILFTTHGQAAGSSYSVTLRMSKGIPRS
jgi:hypothetical protein